MFCARCGKEIDDDSTFCPFCGQSTNEPVESSGGSKPKRSVKMLGKKVIGGISVVAVVLLVVFGISKVIGGISNRAKSLPEKLFAMSAEEYVSLTREGFKDMLEEEGTLYKESEVETLFSVSTLTTDKFMGYDCIYSYCNSGLYSVPASLINPTNLVDYAYFNIAFETEEDFKEGQKSIKKYLEKEMVKKSGILKDEDTDIYLVECSDKGVDEIWKRLSERDDREDFYDRWISAYRALAERTDIIGEDSQINEEALLKTLEDMDYKIYKFVRVSYPPMDSIRNSFPSEKSYADYACRISVCYLPMTEGEYIVRTGEYGFDAISGKEIDEESIDKNLVNMYLDELEFNDSEGRRNLEKMYYFDLYMMVNHKFDTHSKTYIESGDERKLWYIRYFRWDTDADALIDLSNYRNSLSIYCAVECNYNLETEEYFESELDRALFLADNDYKANTGENFGGADDKRLWFMQNYNYDIEPSAKLDSGGKSGAMWNEFSNISDWDTIEYDNVVVSVPAPVGGTNGNGSYDWWSSQPTYLSIRWSSLGPALYKYCYNEGDTRKEYRSGAIDVDGHDVYIVCDVDVNAKISCIAWIETEEDNVVEILWSDNCYFDSFEEVMKDGTKTVPEAFISTNSFEEITENDLKALTDEFISKISFK